MLQNNVIASIFKTDIVTNVHIVGDSIIGFFERGNTRHIFKISGDYLAYKPLDDLSFTEDEFWQPTLTYLNYGSIIDRILKWNGLNIGVEFLPGQVRFQRSKTSKKLRSGYGHVRGYKGADCEALDCYLYPGLLREEPEGTERLFCVTQLSPEDGDFDEHKFMLGYKDIKAAREAYLQETPIEFFGGIQELTTADLEQYRRKPVINLSDTLPFAEEKPDPAELYAKQLQTQTAPTITNWIEQIKDLVEECDSFEEVRDRLFDLYPDLDTASFAEVMSSALVASEAAGRYEVLEEAGELWGENAPTTPNSGFNWAEIGIF